MASPIQVVQAIKPTLWTLAGLVKPQDQISVSSHTLTFARPTDFLSVQIKSIFNAHSIVPKIELNTPKGKVTLTNAKIAKIILGKHLPRSGSSTGKREWEEFDFTYQKIEWTYTDGGKTASDDWLNP